MRVILILAVLINLSGCGVAKFYEETYNSDNYLVQDKDQVKIWMFVSSTNTTKDIFPFYYSSKKLPPYSIYLRAHSKSGHKAVVLIHQLTVSGIEEEIIEVPISEKEINLVLQSNDLKYTEGSINYSLGNVLKFEEEKEIEVCLLFSVNDKSKKKECLVYKGTKHVDTKSNLSVYMSV